MHTATYLWLAFVLVLFLIVREFLRRWGLTVGGKSNRGDFGLGRLFAVVAYFVLWVCPSLIGWLIADLVRMK